MNTEKPTELILVIRWATREQWKSVLQERLDQLEKRFAQQMGHKHLIIEAAEYQVRKFPQT